MLPDRVSNSVPLTYESCALPIALRGPARQGDSDKYTTHFYFIRNRKDDHIMLLDKAL